MRGKGGNGRDGVTFPNHGSCDVASSPRPEHFLLKSSAEKVDFSVRFMVNAGETAASLMTLIVENHYLKNVRQIFTEILNTYLKYVQLIALLSL